MVGFLGQHKPTGPRQRIEAGLGQAFKLHLAVPVGKEGEHEKGQPVRRGFVEGPQHAGFVGVSRAPHQQIIGLLATIATEIFLEEVDHRPEMTSLLHIDLKQIAQVIEGRCGGAEMTLLLDRARLGIPLDDQHPAHQRAVFAGNFLPDRLAIMLTERHHTVFFLGCQQHAPAIFRHPDIVEFGPAIGTDIHRRAQIDQGILKPFRAHFLPPVDITRVPALEGLEHPAVFRQADIVRDLGVVADSVDVDHVGLLWRCCGRLD